ncbi:MAG TPA: hypothetical protein GXX28_05005 [Firmicutes bacterium]|nr:hypothetical protein [Bacillota bacterium]
MAHRDYGNQALGIEVWFYEDRMEVISPGTLIPPVTVEALMSRRPVHASRNPLIVRVLVEAGFMPGPQRRKERSVLSTWASPVGGEVEMRVMKHDMCNISPPRNRRWRANAGVLGESAPGTSLRGSHN